MLDETASFLARDGEDLIALAERHRISVERQLLVARRDLQRRQLARRRRRTQIRRNRCLAALIVVALGALTYLGVDGATNARAVDAKHAVASQIRSFLAKAVVIPGQRPVFSWPVPGQGAVAVLGAGPVAASPAETAVPIASLTKMMTAYVVLQDHPLALGESGPSLVMNAADFAAWVHSSQSDQSNVPVKPGEVLTERQLLEALLLPSTDNIANTLAIWDAGSLARFIAKMNATASQLGLSSTHYADASGVDPASRSTAADQALLASKLMISPLVRSIVSEKAIPFPVAGQIRNVNPALGVDGIIGVKSGYTSKALSCLATASYHVTDGKSVLVVAVTLGQPDGLYGAARVDEGLISAMRNVLVGYSPIKPGRLLGDIEPAGQPSSSVVLGEQPPVLVGWPGLRVTERLVPAPRPSSSSAGTIVFSTPFGELAKANLITANLGADTSGPTAMPSGLAS